jgi:hypothetical protein
MIGMILVFIVVRPFCCVLLLYSVQILADNIIIVYFGADLMQNLYCLITLATKRFPLPLPSRLASGNTRRQRDREKLSH